MHRDEYIFQTPSNKQGRNGSPEIEKEQLVVGWQGPIVFSFFYWHYIAIVVFSTMGWFGVL